MTERVGLLGWPVAHSVSPAMHNAAFAALGLDWRYDLLPVAPKEFVGKVARLIDAGYRGFNVTIPHKHAAFELPQATDITPAAQAIGAVNTLIVNADGTLTADNTDWRGFADDLAAHNIGVQNKQFLVLGTGGSSKAVVYALQHGGAAEIIQVSRRPDVTRGVIGYADLDGVPRAGCVIINTTPVGMSPNVNASPWPEDVPLRADVTVYDLVYNPPVTWLMVQAHRAGAQIVGGLGMLVRQGVLAFEQWTGYAPPVDVMLAAAQSALREG
ncbi:MAG: shikimate dehydrogenase [Anaerolineae bacterium]|nr:shikimate dehydrogenase [Anaerolineae bacterium]